MAEANQDAIIEMYDDDGNEYQFEHLLTFEYDDQYFIAFTPVEPMEEFDVGEVLIMRIGRDDEDSEVYLPIDSQEELDTLWEVFQDLYYEEEEDEAGEDAKQ